jgi:hypothetical protein
MGKLLPIILALFGVGAGVGAGIVLKPEPVSTDEVVECTPVHAEDDAMLSENVAPPPPAPSTTEEGLPTHDYVKLNSQFIIPVVDDEHVSSLVVLSLSLEVPLGRAEAVYAIEPKLRNIFLQVMFDHANMGGFDGAFTSSNKMMLLRNSLLESARQALGNNVNDVLIVDVVRQDV